MEASRNVDFVSEIDRLADEIAEMAAHIDAATHRLLAAIREFDEKWERSSSSGGPTVR